MIHSSNPGRESSPAASISLRQATTSRGVRTKGSITWKLECPASQTRAIASSSRRSRSGSRM